ncbi:hypothetical protein Q7C36_013607 [Tachysurus vachellii]|uniref:Uncharacterized protein n=1 Tax=Tachysurus vachellii TaxID=175792 RepID=A0AA88MJE4_TACVA|nr:hypothetical protein Q7C36_013607 [Tachysurus vachellii]
MNVKILTLVIVLLLSLLCSARAGPVTSTEHSKELEELDGTKDPPAGGGGALDPACPTRGPCHFRLRHCFEHPPLWF